MVTANPPTTRQVPATRRPPPLKTHHPLPTTNHPPPVTLRSTHQNQRGTITDAAVMALVIHCPNLTTIYLNGCVNLTQLAVDAIATRCGKRLTTVGLGCCGQLTDAAATSLARHCPNLVTVVFEAQRAFRRCDTVNNGITNAGEGGGSAKTKSLLKLNIFTAKTLIYPKILFKG